MNAESEQSKTIRKSKQENRFSKVSLTVEDKNQRNVFCSFSVRISRSYVLGGSRPAKFVEMT
jgi:hypothetical protein